jgi:hypothetical protein
MSEDQQLEADIKKVSPQRQPWTEVWEQAEAYQGQQKPGGNEKIASLRNLAKQENDARYLGEKYFSEVCQYLPISVRQLNDQQGHGNLLHGLCAKRPPGTEMMRLLAPA